MSAEAKRISIPVSDKPHQRFSMELNKKVFRFEFHWNVREQGWHMSLWDVAGEPLLKGVRLVICDNVWGPYPDDPRLPPGRLAIQDTDGAGKSPGRDELGKRVTLIYTEAMSA